MSDVEITLRLPEELVMRAKEAGLQIDSVIETVTDDVIAALEKQIRREIAAKNMLTTIAQLNQLPDELKPTLEEIEEEIRAYRAEKKASHTKP